MSTPSAPQHLQYAPPPKPVKNWVVAALLSFFLGGLGIDRFYLGHIGLGIAKLLLSWATFGIWWLIDFILVCVRRVNSDNFYWDDSPEAQRQVAANVRF